MWYNKAAATVDAVPLQRTPRGRKIELMQIGTYIRLASPVDRPDMLRIREGLQSNLRWFAARRLRRPIHWRTVYKPVYRALTVHPGGYLESDPYMAIGSLGVKALTVRSWNPWRAILAWFRLLRL